MKLKRRSLMVLLSTVALAQGLVYGNTLSLNYDGSTHVYDKAPITLYVNNTEVTAGVMPPVQIDGYVLVPIREVFQALGATVQWKSSEKKVYIEKDNSLIVLELNSKEAWVNGEIKEMDIAPKEINEKVMVPIRFISETLGYDVDWLGIERTVHIKEKNTIFDSNLNAGTINQGINNGEISNDYVQEADSLKNEISTVFPFLQYDSNMQKLTLVGVSGLSSQDITITNDYNKHKITFNMNNSSLEGIEASSWQGKLGYLKSVKVMKTDMGAQMVVETNRLCETILTEDQNGITISFVKPNEKYDKIIVIDPGHGGDDSGTRSNGVNEKDLTLSYGKALYKLLENNEDIKVYMTRPEDYYATVGDGVVGKQYPTLNMRVALSNEISPDMYISVHVNYATTASASGIETYYYTSSDKRGQTFANMVQNALVEEFGLRDRKTKHGDLYVIRETNDPAILIETGFISNDTDFGIITAPDYPERFANVVYECILEYYNRGLN